MKFLGIDFEVSGGGNITMSQKEYVERVLKRCGMSECNPRSYPVSEGYCKDVDETEKISDERLYQELVGCSIYITTCTRPDIS